MVIRLFKDRYFQSCFLIFFVFAFSQCSRKDCYRLHFPLSKDSTLTKGSPVVFDNGIAGYVEEVEKSNEGSVAKFCLPNAVQIPKNSKIHVGFIQAFSVYGIKIESSSESGFVNSKELLQGFPMDSIVVNFSVSDTALTNKLINIVKDINEEQKSKRKSTSKE